MDGTGGDGHLVKSRLRLKTQLPLLGTGPRVPTRGTRGPRFWPGGLLLLLASPFVSEIWIPHAAARRVCRPPVFVICRPRFHLLPPLDLPVVVYL